MRLTFKWVLTILCLVTTPLSANTNPNIVVSIAPLHSLVVALTDTVTKPTLLLSGTGSAHHFSFKPSDARTIAQADLIIRASKSIEGFLDQAANSLAPQARLFTLSDIKSLSLLTARDQLHDSPHSSSSVSISNQPTAGAIQQGIDAHIWMNPLLMQQSVAHIAEVLIELDPANTDTYQRNLVSLQRRLKTLDDEIMKLLANRSKNRVLVVHDAYQYFEQRYGVQAVAALHDHGENRSGAQSTRALLHHLNDNRDTSSNCLLAATTEVPSRAVQQLNEDADVDIVIADPLARHLEPGTMQYFEMMHGLAAGLARCLGK